MSTVISHKVVKARKLHVCDFCTLPFEKGTRYNRNFTKFDGIVYVWKSHLSCSHLVTALAMDYGDGVTTDEFKEHINETYDSLTDGANTPSFAEKLNYVTDQTLNHE